MANLDPRNVEDRIIMSNPVTKPSIIYTHKIPFETKHDSVLN